MGRVRKLLSAAARCFFIPPVAGGGGARRPFIAVLPVLTSRAAGAGADGDAFAAVLAACDELTATLELPRVAAVVGCGADAASVAAMTETVRDMAPQLLIEM
jgi:hypothetical protein